VKPFCPLFFVLVLSALSAVAAPPTAANRQEARDRYEKGVKLYKEGDYASALAEFKAAYQAMPTWEVLYNIGLSERRLFRYGQAVKSLNRFLEEGGKKVPKDRRESVEKELEQISDLTALVTVKVDNGMKISVDGEVVGNSPLEPILIGPGRHTFKAEHEGMSSDEKTLEIVSRTKAEVNLVPLARSDSAPGELVFESTPTGAIITVDGRLAGITPTKLQVAPGGHEVLADADNYATTRQEVVVAAGQSRKVVITLERPQEQGSGGEARRLRMPVAGLITMGAGAGVLIGGVVLNTQATSQAKKMSELFKTGGAWDANAQAIQRAGLADQTWAWVLTIAGSAAIAAGLVVTFLTLSSGPEETAFFLAPTPGGVTFGWSFSP
jgi:PEGA domain